ncbi:protein THEM6 [Leptinotarsa decemlineata]|uniref:protein THEM6 n=1 Tax=Leptinotarsa decemlineata TaxID=7539 RepID=UPI000C252632|nr:protein THEM6-like [Leptinotarsa decemlineata]
MDLCLIFLGCVLILLVVYMVLELHYYARSLICLIMAKLKKRVHILDETRMYGICLSTDVDNLLDHMNNARFIRELDFAKIDFNVRTGLYGKIRQHGGSVLLAATTVRYRRLIKIFRRYYITTKIIYWDDQNIYMEHRFVTPGDNFINAIVMCKARLTKCNAEEIMKDLLVKNPDCDVEIAKRQKPELPLELGKWIESNEISSTKLRSNVV